MLIDFYTRVFTGGSSWLLADRIVRIVLGLVVNVALARSLGPENFGLLAYAITLSALFLPLSTLGLERIVVRELARGNVTESSVLGSIVGLRLLGGAVGCGLAVTTAIITGESLTGVASGLVALIAAAGWFQAFDVIDWSFHAKGDFKRGTRARLAAFVIGALLKVGLAYAGVGLLVLGLVSLVEMVIAAGLQWLAWRQCTPAAQWEFDIKLAGMMSRLAAPLLISELAVWIFQKADTIILQRVGGDFEVGLYAVAQRLAQAAYFLPVLAVQFFSPRVAQAESDAAALQLVGRVMRWLVGIAYIVALMLWLAPDVLIRGLFGNAYAASAPLVAWLAWTNVFVFMGCAHSLYLVNRGLPKISLRLTWITAVTSITLNLLLIPQWQALGAAISAVFSYGLTTLLAVGIFPESRPLLRVNIEALLAPLIWLFKKRNRPGIS
ncbi:flippase [Oleiharenicola lentus]|uniref:flippase n=1 Tax=Oleiharenicola lentus TaxID=2508720 RepID=UPI003F67AA50